MYIWVNVLVKGTTWMLDRTVGMVPGVSICLNSSWMVRVVYACVYVWFWRYVFIRVRDVFVYLCVCMCISMHVYIYACVHVMHVYM